MTSPASRQPDWAHQAWPVAALTLIALKPVVDLLAPPARELQLDLGTAWTASSLVILGAWTAWLWVRRQRLGSLIHGLLALTVWTVVHALFLAGVPAFVAGSRVIAAFAPAAILLSSRRARPVRGGSVFVFVFLAGVAVHVVLAWLQFAGVLDATYTQAGSGRPSGGFFHPVTLGYFLVAALLSIAIAHTRRVLPPHFALVLAAAASASLVVSTHRTSLVAGMIVLAVWGVSAAWRTRSTRNPVDWRLIAGAAGFVALALATLPWWGGTAEALLSGVVGVISVEDLDPTQGGFLRGRGDIWAQTIDMFLGGGFVVWLLGFGHQVIDPHSDLLRIPFVHGFAGGVVVFASVFAWVASAWRQADAPAKIWIVAAVATLVVYAITTKPTSFPSFIWAWTLVLWSAVVTRPDGGRGSSSP